MSWPEARAALHDDVQAAFGVPATFTPPGGPAIEGRGVFNAAHVFVTLHDGLEASQRQPVLRIRDADFTAGQPTQGWAVAVDGRSYKVIDRQPDGHDATLLVLQTP